jgi:Uma2 family endonuclease
MASDVQHLTADELLKLPSGTMRQELLRGKLLTMPYRGMRFGCVAANLLTILGTFAKSNELGFVFPGGTGFQTEWNPDTVLTCPAGFVAGSRIRRNEFKNRYIQGAPDLTVEFLDSFDPCPDMPARIDHWISAGSRLVWLIDLDAQSARTFAPKRPPQIMSVADTLDGEDALPGLRLAVAEIFA